MIKLTSSQRTNLVKNAVQARKNIVKMICNGKTGHLGGAMSCLDIVVTLYFEILRLNTNHPRWDNRDRFILSAGHKCLALYTVLAQRGFFDEEELFTYGTFNCLFPGHPDRHKLSCIEANTGSLGHGLPIGVGMALAGKMDSKDYKVYVLLGDGEMAEGSVWESITAASHYKLDNLIAIVDKNKLQIQGPTREVMSMDPLGERWKTFGWRVRQIDGHNFDEIFTALTDVPIEKDCPTAIIANTVKGKGLSFAENNPKYHQWQPTPEECQKALAEIKIQEEV